MQTITWSISIKSIFKDNRTSFVDLYGDKTRSVCHDSVDKILSCRDLEHWFASFKCEDCNCIKQVAFSCKNRFCNSCWTPASDLRLANLVSRRPDDLHYFHLAFTIPKELRWFFRTHRRALSLLPKVATQAIMYFFKKKYKIKPWVLCVIHTFWAQLNRNPHVHLIVTAWWFCDEYYYKYVTFIPYEWVLASWKYYLLKEIKLRVYTHVKSRKLHRIKLCNILYQQKNDSDKLKSWYIYFSKKATSFTIVLTYIGRYLKRPTISQSRILEYDWSNVTYQYTDKYDNVDKTNTVSALKFIWLLIQHIPNKHFHMISYHGIFANRCKKLYLYLLRTYFYTGCMTAGPAIYTNYADRRYAYTWIDPRVCPCWGRYYLYSIIIPGYPPKYFDSW
jgi:hypothetical protein